MVVAEYSLMTSPYKPRAQDEMKVGAVERTPLAGLEVVSSLHRPIDLVVAVGAQVLVSDGNCRPTATRW